MASVFFSRQLSFVFPNEFLAFAAVKAISVGSNKPHEKRSFVEIINNKNVVLLKISAKDRHALNASCYSYERLFNLCQSLSVEVF
ncbi:MAG: CTAG/PCC1 family protein [Candidatus Diapherotrites archaeon]